MKHDENRGEPHLAITCEIVPWDNMANCSLFYHQCSICLLWISIIRQFQNLWTENITRLHEWSVIKLRPETFVTILDYMCSQTILQNGAQREHEENIRETLWVYWGTGQVEKGFTVSCKWWRWKKNCTPSNLGPEILSKESILLLLLPDPRESLCNRKFTKLVGKKS